MNRTAYVRFPGKGTLAPIARVPGGRDAGMSGGIHACQLFVTKVAVWIALCIIPTPFRSGVCSQRRCELDSDTSDWAALYWAPTAAAHAGVPCYTVPCHVNWLLRRRVRLCKFLFMPRHMRRCRPRNGKNGQADERTGTGTGVLGKVNSTVLRWRRTLGAPGLLKWAPRGKAPCLGVLGSWNGVGTVVRP